MYESLHHAAIVVTDLDKAKFFYGEILGFEESVKRPAFNFPGAWYQIGDTQLHLLVHSPAKTLRGTTLIDSKDGHFAVRTNNMEAVKKRLRMHGWDFEDRPDSITGWHQLFVCNPDGNIVEINAKKSK